MTLTRIKLAFGFNIAGIAKHGLSQWSALGDHHTKPFRLWNFIGRQEQSFRKWAINMKNEPIGDIIWDKNANSYCTGERSLFRSPQNKTFLFLLMGDILTVFSMINEFYLWGISYEIQITERSSHLWPVSLFSKPSSMFSICIYEFLLPGLKMSLSTLLFYSRYSYIFGDNQEL